MKEYYITDLNVIKKIIALDPYRLLNASRYSILKIEIDSFEKTAVINTGQLYIRIDYKKTLDLLF